MVLSIRTICGFRYRSWSANFSPARGASSSKIEKLDKLIARLRARRKREARPGRRGRAPRRIDRRACGERAETEAPGADAATAAPPAREERPRPRRGCDSGDPAAPRR